MRPRVGVTIGIVVIVGVFAAANWNTLAAPTTLSLLLAEIQAPLGIVMLLMLGIVMLIYLALLGLTEGRHALAERRMAREIERLRKLAEQSEASRYVDLRAFIESQFAALGERLDRLAQRPAGAPPEARALPSPQHADRLP